MRIKASLKGKKLAIVCSEYNKEVANGLLSGALKAFDHFEGDRKKLNVIRVPGAFDIPSCTIKVIETINPDAVVTLGAVIKGETKHFEYICEACSAAIMEISLNYEIPVLFGILTTIDADQAIKRSQPGKQNKGWETMEAAVKMIDTFSNINGPL